MKRVNAISLVLAGIVVGCGAAAVGPTALSWAAPRNGTWGCYVADRFGDGPAEAADWEGARDIKGGLDQVAGHVPSGTILAITPRSGGYTSVVCVKH